MSTRVPSASFRFINRETFKAPYAKWPNSKNLFCDALRDVGGMKKLLPPLPIARIEKTHKYIWEPTGEQLAFSTTQVCNTKTPEELANIERYRAKWQPRGETAHYALQQRMLGNDKIEMGDYEDWIKPLMDLELWEDFEPWAVEYMLCDLEKSVGGQLDLLGYDNKSQKLMLIDLKTQSQKYAKPYSTDAQMGSYLEALAEHHQIIPDICKTIWARPNKCVVGEDQHTIDCAYAWSQAWKRFDSEQGGF